MITSKDKILLKKLQPEFPLASRPFAVLAEQAGLSEKDMIAAFKRLQKEKILRYIAPMFDMRKLSIVSSLIAMRVPLNKQKKAVQVINAYPNVSHNYLRAGEYNVWFTVSAASERKLKRILSDIRKKTGIDAMLDLKTRKVFKSRAVFDL
ncbi:MAG: Lrp/AsnC family transcriptional regulator [Candidatus Omnitrophica bacterium]|nr:Lrp/AsnC family transcriptional regulator [Candidatus Omnitrophota bacterium]